MLYNRHLCVRARRGHIPLEGRCLWARVGARRSSTRPWLGLFSGGAFNGNGGTVKIGANDAGGCSGAGGNVKLAGGYTLNSIAAVVIPILYFGLHSGADKAKRAEKDPTDTPPARALYGMGW